MKVYWGRYPDDEYMQDGDVVINSTGTGNIRPRRYLSHDRQSPRSTYSTWIPMWLLSVLPIAFNRFMCMLLWKPTKVSSKRKVKALLIRKNLPLTLKEMLIPIPPYLWARTDCCYNNRRILNYISNRKIALNWGYFLPFSIRLKTFFSLAQIAFCSAIGGIG